ncbi:STAS domain-containing protein [Pseudomonas sp. P2663]
MTSSTMAGSARLDTSHSPAQLRVTGDWTLAHYADLKHLSEKLHGQYDDSTHIDLNGLGALDTAGASLLVELLGSERLGRSAEHPDCEIDAIAPWVSTRWSCWWCRACWPYWSRCRC